MRAVGGAVRRVSRYLTNWGGAAGPRMIALDAAGSIAFAYFLAARLGLALLSAPSDVFWLASSLAVGVLIISGRCMYPSLVISVVIGTSAANLLNERIEGIKGA